MIGHATTSRWCIQRCIESHPSSRPIKAFKISNTTSREPKRGAGRARRVQQDRLRRSALNLNETMQDRAYTKHTYKHTTIGYLADVKNMPSQYAYSKTFFDRWYRPENCTIIVAGEVDHEAWSGWPGGGETDRRVCLLRCASCTAPPIQRSSHSESGGRRCWDGTSRRRFVVFQVADRSLGDPPAPPTSSRPVIGRERSAARGPLPAFRAADAKPGPARPSLHEPARILFRTTGGELVTKGIEGSSSRCRNLFW